MIDEKLNIIESQELLKAKNLEMERSLTRLELDQVDLILAFKTVLKSVIRLAHDPDKESPAWIGQLAALVEKTKLTLEEVQNLATELSRAVGLRLVLSEGRSEERPAEELPHPEGNVNEYVKRFLRQIASHRGYRFNEEALGLIRKIDEGQPKEIILSALTQLMCRFIQDYSEEKNQITARLSNIIKTLMNTEEQFKRLLRQSISYIDEENREFNETLTEGLTMIQDSCNEAHDEGESLTDAEKLLTLIAVKVEVLCQSIEEKTLQDERRLQELHQEKTTLESRLDSVRRDYDTFVSQSHKLLKELEDFKSISMRDALTGVYNRRAYDEAVNISIENFRNSRLETFSLLIFDIDHFRDVNNTYGHQAGDSILSHMGRIVSDLLRCDDFIFRYGGDEFIIMLPEAKLTDASKVAEKIRRAVAGVEFKLSRHSDKTIHVSISMGVTEIRPGDNAISVLARADTALYVSKQNGRNQVTAD
ncbi:MAG: GGDEF domain-containing protein [Deltaproteobacteria bacterium]|jgi:diguanylate cyclase|nr:GGDEF domain-containing protein [Deltaproteobacteria bacterium]